MKKVEKVISDYNDFIKDEEITIKSSSRDVERFFLAKFSKKIFDDDFFWQNFQTKVSVTIFLAKFSDKSFDDDFFGEILLTPQLSKNSFKCII